MVMPATTTMTDFLAMDRHGSGDATSCSIRVASRCDMASLPARAVPGLRPGHGAPRVRARPASPPANCYSVTSGGRA